MNMLKVVAPGVAIEPCADARLLQYTKAVDHHLELCSAPFNDVSRGGSAALAVLQQQFEADMTSNIWLAFSDQDHESDSQDWSSSTDQSAPTSCFLPGFGNIRRNVKRYPRSERLSQNPSRLELYLDDNVCTAGLADLWSRATSRHPSIPHDSDSWLGDMSGSDVGGYGEVLNKWEPTEAETAPAAADVDQKLTAEWCDSNAVPKHLLAEHNLLAQACAKNADAPFSHTPVAIQTPPRPSAAVQPGQEAESTVGSFVGSQQFRGWPTSNAQLEFSEHHDPRQRLLFRNVLYGVVLCLFSLPCLWKAQQALECANLADHSFVLRLFRQSACLMFIPTFLYCALQPSHTSWQTLLHFKHEDTEMQFTTWFNSSRAHMDFLVQMVWVVSAVCIWIRGQQSPGSSDMSGWALALSTFAASSPVLSTALLKWLTNSRYTKHRELLLVASKGCYLLFTAAMMHMHNVMPPRGMQLSWPVIASSQLVTSAFMQVRLSVFLPVQVVHLLLALCSIGPDGSVLYALQLFGAGFCCPVLLLYSKELSARKGFVEAYNPKYRAGWSAARSCRY